MIKALFLSGNFLGLDLLRRRSLIHIRCFSSPVLKIVPYFLIPSLFYLIAFILCSDALQHFKFKLDLLERHLLLMMPDETLLPRETVVSNFEIVLIDFLVEHLLLLDGSLDMVN